MDEYVSCDQCSSRAFVFAQLVDGHELSYCMHHGKHHTPALHASGAIVWDMSHMVEA